MLKKIWDFLFKERESLKPLHRHIMQENRRIFNQPLQVPRAGSQDYQAQDLGNGMHRMVPSNDVVDYEERCRRLKANGRM
jgi:hypothetical protein